MNNLAKNHMDNLCGIKELLMHSQKWSSNLSGACNVSSIIVQAYFEKHGITSKIVNNSYHSFNVINETIVVDLTACQISNDEFDSFIEIDNIKNMQERVEEFPKSVNFFNLKDPRFLIVGSLKDILTPLKDKNDIKYLKMIMNDVCDIIFLTNKYSDDFNSSVDDDLMSSYNDLILLGKKISIDLINKI